MLGQTNLKLCAPGRTGRVARQLSAWACLVNSHRPPPKCSRRIVGYGRGNRYQAVHVIPAVPDRCVSVDLILGAHLLKKNYSIGLLVISFLFFLDSRHASRKVFDQKLSKFADIFVSILYSLVNVWHVFVVTAV